MAFSFVQKYISQFGGDPTKVTVFGQSAGARSADFHLLTMSNPPFRAVIMESGSAELIPLADFRRASANASSVPAFMRLASAVGCDSQSPSLLDCMRKISSADIKNSILSQSLYFPCIDDNGFTTVTDEAATRKAGKAAKVPILMGTNLNEQTTSVKSEPSNLTLTEYLDTIFPFPQLGSKIKTAYGVGQSQRFVSNFDAISAVETDLAYTCLTAREANISAQAGIRKYTHAILYIRKTHHC
jgi:carboxylesterase type B